MQLRTGLVTFFLALFFALSLTLFLALFLALSLALSLTISLALLFLVRAIMFENTLCPDNPTFQHANVRPGTFCQ